MKSIKEMSEKELRDVEEFWPKSIDELTQYINDLTDRQHDYGTCVYAMSLAAVATFHYIASTLGCSGFQASCADLDIIKRTRNMKDGFRIIDYGKLLYPQYITDEHFPDAVQLMKENQKRLKERAKELLENSEHASEKVKRHWKYIIDL